MYLCSAMRRNRHILLIACLMTNIAQGQAVRNDTITDRTHQLREVTVTESRRQHEVKSTAPLRILDHEQMLSLGVTDVADALHRMAGVTLRDYGGAGGLKTVSVRGFSAKHTGVSYDGIMLSDCQSGHVIHSIMWHTSRWLWGIMTTSSSLPATLLLLLC